MRAEEWLTLPGCPQCGASAGERCRKLRGPDGVPTMLRPEPHPARLPPVPPDPLVRVLVRARLDAGLTQAEVAKRAGVSQAAVSRMESGAARPTLWLVQQVAGALRFDLDLRERGTP